MALCYAPSGTASQREPNGSPTAIYHPGASVSVASGATSANVALPVDGNGKPYTAVLVSATAAAWIAFGTSGSDAVVAATSPAILVNFAPVVLAVPPAGAGIGSTGSASFIAAIQAATAGTVNVVGLY
jgi:hypothetical protein